MTLRGGWTMILVVGASGMLGGRVASRLLQAGEPVRALTRDPGKLEELRALGAEIVEGDLRRPASLAIACTGVRRVLTTANAFLGGWSNSTEKVDRQGNRHLIDAARDAGVQQLVFVSAAAADRASRVDFFRMKAETEDYLRESGLPFTILRPGAFMEIWAELIGGKADRGVATILGRGENPMNFVAVDDVADVAVRALRDPRALGQTLEFGGDENLTPLQVASIYEEALGRPLRRKHVPRGMMRVLGAILSPLLPAVGRTMRAGLASDTVPQEMVPPGIPEWLGVRPTPFRDWLRARSRAGAAAVGSP